MPQSWYMRRILTDVPPSVTSAEVKGYKQVDNHKCIIEAVFSNGTEYKLNARVSCSCTYSTTGERFNERWTVHGINAHGISVLMKVI